MVVLGIQYILHLPVLQAVIHYLASVLYGATLSAMVREAVVATTLHI